MFIDSAAAATLQPSSIRPTSRSRPSGVSGALPCTAASLERFVLPSTAPQSPRGPPTQRMSTTSQGTTPRPPTAGGPEVLTCSWLRNQPDAQADPQPLGVDDHPGDPGRGLDL